MIHFTDQFSKPIGKPDEEVVRILIDRGANIDNKCHNGKTPLHFAAQYGKYSICPISLFIMN